MVTCADRSESQALKSMRLILILSSVFGMVACSDSIFTSTPLESGVNRQDTSTDNSAQRLIESFTAENIPKKTIETPSGPRDVYDPTQIPRDVSLVFDETLNRAYEYFSHLKDCDDELEWDKKDICMSHIKNVYGDLWGNRFKEGYKFTDPLVPTYPSSAFKWRLTLHGSLDEFVISSTSLFPSNIDDELVTLYLDHHENVDVIKRLPVRDEDRPRCEDQSLESLQSKLLTLYLEHHDDDDLIKRLPVRDEDRPRYEAQSLESLRSNVPEFKLSDFMPKEYNPGPVLSGHEFTMLFGEENSEVHQVWNTTYSASNCQRGRRESFFYKIKIGYESAWLREFMGGRNIATIHVCAPLRQWPQQVTIFRLE